MKKKNEDVLVDKVNYKRAMRMQGLSPHKLFKMEIKKYLDKKKAEEVDCNGDV